MPSGQYDRTAKAMKAEAPTDEDLGIGEDDAEESAADAGDGSFEALLNDPRMAKLLDAAVAARMAQMGVGANGGSATSSRCRLRKLIGAQRALWK